MQIQSTLPNAYFPFPLNSAAPVRSGFELTRSSVSLHEEVTDFCRTVRQQAAGLDFTKRSLASDILSIFAAGAVIESMRQGELNHLTCTKVLIRMLRELFGWEEEITVRVGALLWASRHAESRLAGAVKSGGAAFRAWRTAPESLESDDFREIYVALAD